MRRMWRGSSQTDLLLRLRLTLQKLLWKQQKRPTNQEAAWQPKDRRRRQIRHHNDTQHDLFEWHTSVRPRQHVSALGRMCHEEDNHRRDGAVPYLLYGHPIHFFVHSVCSTSSYVGGHDIFFCTSVGSKDTSEAMTLLRSDKFPFLVKVVVKAVCTPATRKGLRHHQQHAS